jgi:phenylacetate-coenzyme A ligase PaaK-like adenylate-forming protein
MTNMDFQKPLETMKSLMALQASTLNKSIELQKKSGEELASFFKSEMDKAKELKTPEDVVKFNLSANKELFELLKSQGEQFSALATQASQSAMDEMQKLAK